MTFWAFVTGLVAGVLLGLPFWAFIAYIDDKWRKHMGYNENLHQ